MHLLQAAERKRAERNEAERLRVRERLRAALTDLLPAGTEVWLYGSVTKPGLFREWSDVDLALTFDPPGLELLHLMSDLSERTERPVDVSVLSQTRLRETILREGEMWML